MRGVLQFAALVLVGLIIATVDAAADNDRRVALVIGNSSYAEAPLKNPVNDARAVAKALRDQGFDVILKENAGKGPLESAVADFGEKLSEGATGLFYYAGHGMQVNGRNYLIPVDAKIRTENRVRIEAVDVDLILEQMQAARTRVSLVVLDACRNNPFERRFRGFGGGLAQINAPEGTLIAYATAPGKVAADGDSANGLYTQEFLKAMKTPGLKVEDVFKTVRVNVSRASEGAQVPWEASSLTGDFYFNGAAPVAVPLLEYAFWDAVKNSSDASELQFYLRQFPNGVFAEPARARLATLLPPGTTAREPQPAVPTAPVVMYPSAPPALQPQPQITAAQASAPSAPPARRPEAQAAPVVPAPVVPAAVASLPAPTVRQPELQASLSSPASKPSAQSFDGRYHGVIAGTTGSNVSLNAVLTVANLKVSGFAIMAPEGRLCRVWGTIGDDGSIPGIEIYCATGSLGGVGNAYRAELSVTLTGRFGRMPDDVAGETQFRSSEGKTGSVTWRRQAEG